MAKKTRDTTIEAHDAVQPVAADLRASILEAVTAAPEGLTCEDVEGQLGLRHQTASARINELSRAGKIRDAGRRENKSGAKAIVWKVAEAPARTSAHELSRPTALAFEGDCFAFLASLKGARLSGCITDLPYPTLERHRARGTTTRLKASDASSNPWFGTLTIPQLVEALSGIYDALDDNAYAFVYVDDSTAILLAHELGVAPALAKLIYRATSEAPRDRIGFAWWNPATWVKTSNGKPLEPRGGAGYHFPGATERILMLEKGKSQLLAQYPNAFPAPRPLHPKGATRKSATAKPVSIAEKLTRAMSAPGGRILDPFVGCGTHAEGITRAGCQAVVGDIDLGTFRDWQRHAFKREWMEARNGQWERFS